MPASMTWYQSYAPCCPNNPNYDPTAPTEECDLYSACDYPGVFAYTSPKSFQWVQDNSIAAFFSANGDNDLYAAKEIRLSALGKDVTVKVVDTCGDSDCGGCCTTNAQPSGYLVDLEYWTAVRLFGGTDAIFGQLCWQLVEGQISPPPPPGADPCVPLWGDCTGGGGCCLGDCFVKDQWWSQCRWDCPLPNEDEWIGPEPWACLGDLPPPPPAASAPSPPPSPPSPSPPPPSPSPPPPSPSSPPPSPSPPPPSPSPPPPSPSPPPAAFAVSAVLSLAGSVSDVTPAALDAMRQVVAAEAGAPLAAVTASLAGSVLLTFRIALQTEGEADAAVVALAEHVGDADAASTWLGAASGLAISVTEVITPPTKLTLQPPAPPPPPSSSPLCEDTDKKCVPKKCKSYNPAKLAKCKKTCGLCESPPSAPPPAPPSPPPCEDTDKKCIPQKCKSYDPAKLAKCKETCGLCDTLPPSPPPPKVDCEGFNDNKKCKIKRKKCNKNPPKTMKKCKKSCVKDRNKKKPLCQKTCCELGFPVI